MPNPTAVPTADADHVTEAAVPKLPIASSDGSATRYDFLDGLRGLTALYVACDHIVWHDPRDWGPAAPYFAWLDYGHAAVAIFIVLSGYCLMLPVAHSADGTLRGGLKGFVRRRARRILPPYYAAFAISVLLVVNTYRSSGFSTLLRRPDLCPASVLSHVALVHNLSPRFITSISPPLWTVATEWQIYFVFAIVLLPIWKRWGSLACFGWAVVIGMAPHFLLPASYGLDRACPWYLGLFAMGMIGASRKRCGSPGSRVWLTAHASQAAASAVLLVAFLLTSHLHGTTFTWVPDLLVGGSAACLIVYCVECQNRSSDRSSFVLQVLQSSWARGLGEFSYSLYLIHYPLWHQLRRMTIDRYGLHGVEATLVRTFFILPMAIVLCYFFYLAFERPFKVKRRAPARHAPAPLQPAPL